MGQALYRKYRSKSLDEVVGQTHITKTLKNALKDGRISHAYLFTGPRGTGKTSIARLLAHAINDLPYADEKTHLDIIEIDAASNNGVEDVRDLREKVRLAPTSAKYKVYIIDEVHMLSGAAFNALLKTLEEPPEHAVFILATTEAHKLPATIISRTQRFHFQPIPLDKAVAHLRSIADKEKITVDDDALTLIAERGEGTLRDSISLLDQLRNVATEGITVPVIEANLGLAPQAAMAGLIALLQQADIPAMVNAYDKLLKNGVTAAALASQLMRKLQTKAAAQPALYSLIDQLIEVPRAYDPRLKLEVILASYMLSREGGQASPKPQTGGPHKQTIADSSSDATHTPSHPANGFGTTVPAEYVRVGGELSAVDQSDKTEDKKVESSLQSTALESSPIQPYSAGTVVPKPLAEGDDAQGASAEILEQSLAEGETNSIFPALTDDLWQQIVTATKPSGPTLHTIIRQAIPYFDADKQLLTLTFRFPLHQKRIEEQRHKQEFFKILQQVVGVVPKMQIVVNKNAVRNIPAVKASPAIDENLPSDASAATVMTVMGGGEVVSV